MEGIMMGEGMMAGEGIFRRVSGVVGKGEVDCFGYGEEEVDFRCVCVCDCWSELYLVVVVGIKCGDF